MKAILRRRIQSAGLFIVLGTFVGMGVGLVIGRLDQLPAMGAGVFCYLLSLRHSSKEDA